MTEEEAMRAVAVLSWAIYNTRGPNRADKRSPTPTYSTQYSGGFNDDRIILKEHPGSAEIKTSSPSLATVSLVHAERDGRKIELRLSSGRVHSSQANTENGTKQYSVSISGDEVTVHGHKFKIS